MPLISEEDCPLVGDGIQLVDSSGRRRGWRRPVALPEDVDRTGFVKEKGTIVLPLRVSWSGPERSWDLADRRQRRQVYEMVLTEGSDDDVRRFIDVDELIALWPELYLPEHVRVAWKEHLTHLRGVHLAC